MGIGLPALEALCWAHDRRGLLGKTLQISRQGLYIGGSDVARADDALRKYGRPAYFNMVGGSQTADAQLFPAFGATEIHTSDISAYEGAEIIWDFNDPVPAEWHERYDTVLDFGSLEHIFNAPVALANMMNLVRVGGCLLSVLPANNWLGHGFYQFGTEMPYRVFHAGNGFEPVFVALFGLNGERRLVEQTDQGASGVRGEIGLTADQIDLVFCARRISDVRPFRRWPQQGDYAAAWALHEGEAA